MKDILLYVPVDSFAKAQYEYMPAGVLGLSAVLSQAGYEVDVVHGYTKDIQPGYKFYGLSAATVQYSMIKDALVHIRQIEPEAKVIAGGPHFTARSCIEDALKDDWDCIVSGDGEFVLRDIVSGKTDISSRVIYGKPIMDLDSLPLPDWDKIDLRKYNYPLRPGLKCTTLVPSRGCPYNCQYCSSSRTTLRVRSVDNVLAELDILINKYGFNSLMMAIDSFSFKKEMLKDMLSGFESRNIKWRSLIRAETIDNDMLGRMARSGCVEIGPGIESGSQKILDGIKKGSKVEKNKKFIRDCEDIGIRCVPSFMIGLPNESPDTILETYEFMKEVRPGAFAYNILMPFPDSPIYLQRNTTYKDSLTIYPYTWDDCVTKCKKITKCFVSTPYLSREQILSEYYKYYDIFADITGFDPRKRGSRKDD